MRNVAAAVLVMTAAAPVWAGEYLLVITDHPEQPCGAGEARGEVLLPSQSRWTVRSGADVAADVARYFRGDDTKDILVWFRDGHFRFCGHRERAAVYEALLDAAGLSSMHHERELCALMAYLASGQLRNAIDARLAHLPRDSVATQRLQRMRTAVQDALSRRGGR